MTTQQINEKLQIVNIKGKKFKADPKVVQNGYYYYSKNIYAFYVAGLGYLAFQDDPYTPYCPCGGRKALQSIIDAGGMLEYSTITWIQELA